MERSLHLLTFCCFVFTSVLFVLKSFKTAVNAHLYTQESAPTLTPEAHSTAAAPEQDLVALLASQQTVEQGPAIVEEDDDSSEVDVEDTGGVEEVLGSALV